MVTVQVHWPDPPHGVKTASRQANPAQQLVPPAEHVWPGPTQDATWQVPAVAPAGTTQLLPLQQSAVVVQTPPCGWHTTGAPQVPALQICEQHCAENWQDWPFATHNGPPSVPPSLPPAPPSDPPVSKKGRQAPSRQ
jgi:hypothetical protein